MGSNTMGDHTVAVRHRLRRLVVVLAVLVGFLAVTEGRSSAVSTQFCNTAPMSGPYWFGGPVIPKPVTPYPSGIAVSGLIGTVVDVDVSLLDVTTYPSVDSGHWVEDLDVLVAGPTGKNVILMSDAGGNNDTSVDRQLNAVDLTFDDEAAARLPTDTALSTGSWRPVDDDEDYQEANPTDSWPAPAPPLDDSTDLTDFNATSPNGTWNLFAADDTDFAQSDIVGGWCLDITTTGPAPTVQVTVDPTPASLPVGGGDVTYSVLVKNTGTTTATIESLTDDKFGDLTSRGTCTNAVGTELAAAGEYSCSFVGAVSGSSAPSSTNTVTVLVEDQYDQQGSDTDHATVTIAKAPQAITFTSTPPTGARVGGPAYVVGATGGGSGKPVTFTLADTSTGCALSGNRVTFTAVGTCRINANQAGSPTYTKAPQVRQSFPVKAAPLPPPTISTSTHLTGAALGVYGQEHKLVFRATVTASNKLRPPGKVVVRVGSTTLCTITLVNGAGTCSPSPTALPVGTYSVTATYQRSGAYAASTSTAKTLFIVPS